MSELNPNSLRARHRDLEVEVAEAPDGGSGELRIAVPSRHARALLGRLYEEESTKARRLVDLTAIDRWGPGPGVVGPRFEVIYRLESLQLSAALRVHAWVDEGETTLESVTGIWPVADWLEREVFDLFGLVFKGHPDLRRLLLEPGYVGAPLRKDSPLGGSRGTSGVAGS